MKIFCYALIMSSLYLFGSNYSDGIEALKNNDIDSAIKKFESSINDNEKVEQSAIMVAFLKSYQTSGPEEIYSVLKNHTEQPEYLLNSMFDLIYAASGDTDYAEFFEDLEDTIEQIQYSRLRDNVIEAVSNSKKAQAQYDDWIETKELINSINDWQVVGVFDNLSGLGFDANYEPINNAKPDAVFKNRFDAGVKWFDLKGYGKGEWLRFYYYFDVNNGIIFSQTFVNSPVDQKIQANLGVSGSVKLWVNDQLNFKEEEELNNGQNAYVFEINLKKGWNRVLVQMGGSEDMSPNFFLTLTDFDGNYLKDLTYSNQYNEYPKLSGENIKVIENPHLTYLRTKIAENEDDIAYYLALLRAASYDSRFKDYNLVREKIKSIMPNTILDYLVDKNYYLMRDNSTLFTKTVENIKKLSDDYLPALEYFWSDAIDNKNVEKLKELYDKMKYYPQYFSEQNLLAKSIIISAYNSDYKDAIKTSFKGNEKYPSNQIFLALILNYYIEGLKDYDQALDLIDDYLDENYDTDMLTTYATLTLETGDLDECIDILLDNQEVFPSSIGIYKEIVDAYSSANMYNEAITYNDKCIELAPYYYYFYQKKADLYNLNNQKEEAKKYYARAINYFPLDYYSREKIQRINNDKSLFELMGEPDLDSIYYNTETDEDENIYFLHNEVKSIAYENGGFEQKFYYLYKALDKKGVDILKEYSIGGFNNQRFKLEEAKLLKADGSEIKAEQNGSLLVFPGMEEGDAIKVIYKLWTYNGYSLTNHFWDSFSMNFSIPTRLSKYTLAIENDKKFNYLLTNDQSIEPTLSNINRFKLYEWTLDSVPMIKSESHMPEMIDVSKVLHVSSIPDWEFVVNWYDGMTKNRIKKDDFVNKELVRITEGATSDLEKVKLAYEYIANEIRYSSISFRQSGYIPQKSKSVIDQKIGDCKDLSTLLVNFCNEIGVDANLVLVKTRDYGKNSLVLPSVNFNHCAVQINIDDEKYFVETTSEYLPFGAVPVNSLGQQILPIKEGSSKVLNLYEGKRPINSISRKTKIDLSKDSITLEKNNTKCGYYAYSMRSSYKYLNEEDKYERMKKAITDENPSLKLEELDFSHGLDNNSDSVVYKYKYSYSPDFIEANNLLIYQIDWTEKFENTDIVAPDTREHPIEVYKYMKTELEEERIEITLNDGLKLSSIPENQSISNELFDFSITFEAEGNKVIAKRLLKVNKNIIKQEDYLKFKETLTNITKAEKSSLVLETKS